MRDRRRLCLARVPGNGRHRRWHGAGDEDGPEMPLDAHVPQPTLSPMDLRGNQTPTLRRPAKRLSLLWVVASGFGCCLGVLPATAVPSAVAGETPQPILEFNLEASPDLNVWTRLGPFAPGNVAAFFFDPAPESAHPRKFYRSVYVPPRRM